MGRAPLHLIQVLELVVLFLGVLRGGEGSETEGSRGGAWGLGLDPRPSSRALPPKDPNWRVGVLMVPLLGWWPVRGWGEWMKLHVLTVGGW